MKCKYNELSPPSNPSITFTGLHPAALVQSIYTFYVLITNSISVRLLYLDYGIIAYNNLFYHCMQQQLMSNITI